MRVQRQRNRVPLPVKILLCVVLITGASFSLAWVWHTTQQSAAAESRLQPSEPESSASESSESSLQPVAQSVSTPSEPDSEPESSDPPEVSQEVDEPVAPSAVEGAVPESEPVDASYFDDAIFFGDSISTGIPLYHIADNAAVVAMTGINTDNINYKPAIDVGEEERITFIEAARRLGPRSKVYIMLGGNGLGFDKQTFIAGYETFLDSVMELYPDAIIYLQSMTPVTSDYVNEYDPELNNRKIDEYNLEILELAKRKNIYYLDVNSALKDETGALPKEASKLDGMHFSPEYYLIWFDYLKTHTVEEKT